MVAAFHDAPTTPGVVPEQEVSACFPLLLLCCQGRQHFKLYLTRFSISDNASVGLLSERSKAFFSRRMGSKGSYCHDVNCPEPLRVRAEVTLRSTQ